MFNSYEISNLIIILFLNRQKLKVPFLLYFSKPTKTLLHLLETTMIVKTSATSTVTDILSTKTIILDIPLLLLEILEITKIKIKILTLILIQATIKRDTTMKVISPMNLTAMIDKISNKQMNKSTLLNQINHILNKRMQNDFQDNMDLILMLLKKQCRHRGKLATNMNQSRHQWNRYLWINLILKILIRFRVLIFLTVKFINLIKRYRIQINLMDTMHKGIKKYYLILMLTLLLLLIMMKSMGNKNKIS